MVKDITNPYLSPSRAVVLVRERAKRRQGCIWAGLMSAERAIIRSAEVLIEAEGNTAWTAMVRFKRAPRRLRTHARMYVQGRDLGGLLAAQRLGRGRQSQGSCRAEDERRGGVRCDDSSDEAGEQSAGDRVAELVERSVAPEGKSENPTHTGRRAGLRVSHGWTGYGYGLVSRPINVMRGGAT